MRARPDNGDPRRALVVPDKFRSTATAAELRAAITVGAVAAGFDAVPLSISDGGDGLLDALGGEVMTSTVTGPLGHPVEAEWRLDGDTAVIEMARASGLALVEGENDPVAATTYGTGELIARALDAGARRVVVGCGGSATSDGGRGAVDAIGGRLPDPAIDLVVACDVATTFLDAADVFAPQKGATPTTVRALRARLRVVAAEYDRRFGVDPTDVARAGAAGGLAGGLLALGGVLCAGIDLVAESVGLDAEILRADVVVTGEGRLDATSFEGKVVGDLCRRAIGRRPLLVICGEATEAVTQQGVRVVDLSRRFSPAEARTATLECVAAAVTEELDRLDEWGRP